MKRHSNFITERDELISRHNITKLHAECYMCNFGDPYLCYEYNGGCKSRKQCESIYKKEMSDKET